MHFTTPSYQNSKMLLKKTNKSKHWYYLFISKFCWDDIWQFSDDHGITFTCICNCCAGIQCKSLVQITPTPVFKIGSYLHFNCSNMHHRDNLHILICFYWQIAIFRQRSWVLIRSQYSRLEFETQHLDFAVSCMSHFFFQNGLS